MTIRVILTFAFVMTVGAWAADDDGFRTWTSVKGQTVAAKLDSVSRDGVITLLTKDGKKLRMSLTTFCEEDRNFLAKTTRKGRAVGVHFVPEFNAVAGTDIYQAKTEAKSIYEGDTISFTYIAQYTKEKADDSDWTVTKTTLFGSQLTDSSGDKVTSDGQFVRVEFTVKNTGKKKVSMRNVPKIVDQQDRKYELHSKSEDLIPKDTTDPDWAEISPGFTKHFAAVYEIPADSKPIGLEVVPFETYKYQDVFLPMGEITIKLFPVSESTGG